MAVICGALAVTLAGCGSCGQRSDEAAVPAPDPEAETEAVAEPVPVGVVEGVVRLAPGAELPSYTDKDLGKGAPGTTAPPEKCPPPKKGDRQPVSHADGGGLRGVMVNAIDFDASPAHEPATHEVAIRDCRLEPRLVVATRGDKLRMVNESDHPFLPRRSGDSFGQGLMKGQDRVVDLDRGGIFRVSCFMGATCGRTDVVVLYHPVHTTTGEGGRFRLENVPAGQALTVHAWHPLFEESSAEVQVAEGETRTVEIELRPLAPAEPGSEHPDR
jgi:hypothetical protein